MHQNLPHGQVHFSSKSTRKPKRGLVGWHQGRFGDASFAFFVKRPLWKTTRFQIHLLIRSLSHTAQGGEAFFRWTHLIHPSLFGMWSDYVLTHTLHYTALSLPARAMALHAITGNSNANMHGGRCLINGLAAIDLQASHSIDAPFSRLESYANTERAEQRMGPLGNKIFSIKCLNCSSKCKSSLWEVRVLCRSCWCMSDLRSLLNWPHNNLKVVLHHLHLHWTALFSENKTLTSSSWSGLHSGHTGPPGICPGVNRLKREATLSVQPFVCKF